MVDIPGRWQSGDDAWRRLRARDGDVDDEHDAVETVADVGLVRYLLDQTELEAVRSARRQGTSWAQIATWFGMTRQSAWERWKDLDDEPGPAKAVDDAAGELVLRATRLGRLRSLVKVPNVVGLTWEGAELLLRRSGLTGVPSGGQTESGLVTDQSPESGAKVPPGTAVTLWIGRGGGSAGVREPRRPSPSPLEAHARPDVA